ncbi:MAG: efflux transporter periplasmic adaptor subunit [Bacteroidetes bacterium]|nr:efflux transporter periplasmic adaptor subunit [Bacteroidota bacterium]
MNKRTKIWIGIAAILVLILIGFFTCKKDKQQPAVPETAKVTMGTISASVTATGTVSPIKTITVGTQVSGTISKIYVDYNSVIKKGQLLAELDKTVLNSTYQSALTDLNVNKTQMDYQEKNFNRIKDLYAKQAVSKTDYETAEYNYNTARLNYKKSQSDVIKAKTNLNYATIYSPIDGVVLSRAVEEGQTVAAAMTTPTLFTITNDLSHMQVLANVDEADIGQVKEGQNVTFTVDAYPDDIFKGTVTQVRLEATTTSNVVTYKVVIMAPNPEFKLKPGLTASVNIYTMEKNNVLIIPNKALNYSPTGKKVNKTGGSEKQVWIQQPTGSKAVKILIGSTDATHTEVLQGLKAGDEVIIGEKAAVTAPLSEQKSEGSSPFMPKRPGNDSKRTKTAN